MSMLTLVGETVTKTGDLDNFREMEMRLENMTGGRRGEEDKSAGDSSGTMKERDVDIHVH